MRASEMGLYLHKVEETAQTYNVVIRYIFRGRVLSVPPLKSTWSEISCPKNPLLTVTSESNDSEFQLLNFVRKFDINHLDMSRTCGCG